MEVFDLVQSLKFQKVASDDDWVDRMNRIHTVSLLLVSCMAITAYTFLGDPLICWNSGQLKAHAKYVNTMCWISNTYWLPLRQQIPSDISVRTESEINYYQWVALILLVQCFCFYFPRLIWRALRSWCGFDIKKMANRAVTEFDPKKRDDTTKQLAQHFHDCVLNLRTYRNGIMVKVVNEIAAVPGMFCFGKRSGNRFFNCYIFIKFLYFLNSFGQLFILHLFLTKGQGNFFTGMNLINNWVNNHAWQETGKFPRTTMCDFEIRVMGNLQRHTVQCVLPINMFNEKIYLLLWFWMAFITVANFISFVWWTFSLVVPGLRESFIKNYIARYIRSQEEKRKERGQPGDTYQIQARASVYRFVHSHLRRDGVFALKLMHANSNDFVIYDLIKHLYERFMQDEDNKRHRKERAAANREKNGPAKV